MGSGHYKRQSCFRRSLSGFANSRKNLKLQNSQQSGNISPRHWRKRRNLWPCEVLFMGSSYWAARQICKMMTSILSISLPSGCLEGIHYLMFKWVFHFLVSVMLQGSFHEINSLAIFPFCSSVFISLQAVLESDYLGGIWLHWALTKATLDAQETF